MMRKQTKLLLIILIICILVSTVSCGKREENKLAHVKYSISCANFLNESTLNMLPKEKHVLIPKSGWLIEPEEVAIKDGESVFDVLLRLCRDKKVHMEYEDTPIYDSAYIEGIGNLYEFDAGNLSGWMFSVNGQFPNYGCSKVYLHDGDIVEWVYTCNLGEDVGNKVNLAPFY